jgi:hypothetical protein
MNNDIILRFRVQTHHGVYSEILPSGYKNWQIWISPHKGFGQGYATISNCNTAFQIVVNQEGVYNVLAIGELS